MSLLISRGMQFETLFEDWANFAKATTTGTYGIVPQGFLSERVKMIEAVNYSI